ncbi:MAG: putative membrane protein YphA (DoxX/SURF4 family) [Sphingobacteriales bacterium]|jgi:uncharacterized membrane protein YphA (DoxX/SURF4 family)
MNYNFSPALLLIRLLLGVIFFLQGLGKVFKIGVEHLLSQVFTPMLQDTFVPYFIQVAIAYFTSYAELIGGLFLLLGLFRKYTYMVLALVLVVVSIGHGIAQPIWDLTHVFYRASFLVFLIVIPFNQDKYSLDQMINNKSNKN